jgi:hypothetical protein
MGLKRIILVNLDGDPAHYGRIGLHQLPVPKRLRYFLQRDGAVLNMVQRVIKQTLQTRSPGAASVGRAVLQIGAVALIHRFGSNLNEHVHFHVCVVDGAFVEVAGDVIFHPNPGIDEVALAQVHATLRRRILRAFVSRGLLQSCDAKDMLAYLASCG